MSFPVLNLHDTNVRKYFRELLVQQLAIIDQYEAKLQTEEEAKQTAEAVQELLKGAAAIAKEHVDYTPQHCLDLAYQDLTHQYKWIQRKPVLLLGQRVPCYDADDQCWYGDVDHHKDFKDGYVLYSRFDPSFCICDACHYNCDINHELITVKLNYDELVPQLQNVRLWTRARVAT